MYQPTRSRLAALAVTVAVLGGTLAACGGSSDTTATGAGAPAVTQTAPDGAVFDTADVAFATDMIPHHAQALAMVAMTAGRPLSAPVRRLADAIRRAQAPELEQMTSWLKAWGQPVPATSGDAGTDMGAMTGSGSMPGMMTADEMTALGAASDADFERLWLTMMVSHHDGAVDMAGTEDTAGANPDAIALATSIQRSQTAQIATMKRLLR